MFKNNLRIAFRHLRRHKLYSFISIIGLSIGIAAAFLIFLYVHFELSYDTFNAKADRIYRLVADVKTSSETLNSQFTSPPMGINIKADFPEVEDYVRLNTASLLLTEGNTKYQEDRCMFSDSSLFKIFDFKLIEGNPHTALADPFSIVLTESAAKKYFGNTNPIGKPILLTGGHFMTHITGIMKDIPENSQIKADIIISWPTMKIFGDSTSDQNWADIRSSTYLLLKPGSNPANLESKFPAFLKNRSAAQTGQSNMHFSLFLEPLLDVHLKSGRGGMDTGNISNVYIFTIIGVFVILIASINYVNLTTVRATERAKEVGIRKVVGAERNLIARQFLSESVLVAIIAFLLSLLICALSLPWFNELAGKTISTGILVNPLYIGILFLMSTGIGVIAGLYPAFILASFNPIIVLKGRYSTSPRGLVLRKGLVVLQFTISAGLILTTLIVYNQLHYMRSQDLGFENSQTLVIDTHWDPKRFLYTQRISSIPGVLSTSMSASVPGGDPYRDNVKGENRSGEMQQSLMEICSVDFDFIPQYKMEILAGRSFSKSYLTDSTLAVVLNQSAVQSFGYSTPKEIIGKKFFENGSQRIVIGVVKDFHIRSLKEAMGPMAMTMDPNNWRFVSIRVTTNNVRNIVNALEDSWKETIPQRPFSSYFADEFFDRQYRSEEHFGKLFLNFAILTIVISCMGLLGLSSYDILQRTKEIGIRKVMGASITDILFLLTKGFVKLVLIAFIVAAPIAWILMYQWLQHFPYRTSMSWWIFTTAGFMLIIVTIVTVSAQAFKAATANPLKSFRVE